MSSICLFRKVDTYQMCVCSEEELRSSKLAWRDFPHTRNKDLTDYLRIDDDRFVCVYHQKNLRATIGAYERATIEVYEQGRLCTRTTRASNFCRCDYLPRGDALITWGATRGESCALQIASMDDKLFMQRKFDDLGADINYDGVCFEVVDSDRVLATPGVPYLLLFDTQRLNILRRWDLSIGANYISANARLCACLVGAHHNVFRCIDLRQKRHAMQLYTPYYNTGIQWLKERAYHFAVLEFGGVHLFDIRKSATSVISWRHDDADDLPLDDLVVVEHGVAYLHGPWVEVRTWTGKVRVRQKHHTARLFPQRVHDVFPFASIDQDERLRFMVTDERMSASWTMVQVLGKSIGMPIQLL